MVTDESKYIVYLRNGQYSVCNESYRNMLWEDEIVMDNIDSYWTADKYAADLNWEKTILKMKHLVVDLDNLAKTLNK